ncbi:hypothetical protein [Cupriavidus campinensis]|uniref:Uncharacterized protein n=1 Tax=Cupriavidus campinensis TaxID=151783 RepID=A0ABY3ETB9_9BURK|nr:hypothetical protein [Cupriavidus campinensis]TSP13983.1 hypothetical protein FGG12_05800 [Cupriavidus campinensis]
MTTLEARVREEQGNLPLDYSMRGDNAYYDDFCPTIGHRPGYCVCLHKIQAVKEGRTALNPDCTSAIKGGSCGALARRAEEERAGKSIFYISREVLQAHAKIEEAEAARIAAARAGIRLPPKRTAADGALPRSVPAKVPAKPTDTETLVDFSSGMASAISQAAKEQAAAPATVQAPAPKPEPAAESKVGPISVKPDMLPGETPLQYARRVSAQAV